jgi:putative transcriptional regulator
MDEKLFQDLISGVKDMGRHMRGEVVSKVRITEIQEPDVKALREDAGVSQSEFARLIGVSRRTLENWEQHRSRPTGPARALLKVVAANPKAVVEALHA